MIVRDIATDQGDVWLIPGDIHFDAQDDRALAVMLKVARAFRVNGAILIGDTFESAGISRHGRPGRKFRFGQGTIAAEAEAARSFIERLSALVLQNRGDPGFLHVLQGNHEAWWTGVQDEFPGLVDTPWYELYGDLFNGWHVWDETTALRLGSLLVCHGHRLRGSLSKNSAASVLANYPGQNTLYGHTHRVDQCVTPTYKYGVSQDHGAWTIGHMRDIKKELTQGQIGPFAERHKQGFALVSIHQPSGCPWRGAARFKVDVVTVDRDTDGAPYCVVGGVLFEEDHALPVK